MGYHKNLATAMRGSGRGLVRPLRATIMPLGPSAHPKELHMSTNHGDREFKQSKSSNEKGGRAKIQLAHRRGRDVPTKKEFDSEKDVLEYAKENKLMIVHSERDSDGWPTKMYYLPE